MFTRSQIEEIKDKLADYGIKDTVFKHLGNVPEDTEFAIVTEKKNKRISFETIFNYLREHLIVIE